jgi:L-ascorbate metabolism protein UlaG (beta-lactamase superfamily)
MNDRLTWLGHATVLVELGCAVVLTDPALRRRIAHLRRHAARGRRAGLASASHHLDVPPLGLVDPAARVVAPRGGARALRRSGREVIEVAAGALLELAGVRVRVVPALHDGRRSPLSRPADAVGYVIEAGLTVYFAGDTARFEQMADIGRLDAALLPIWGWGSRLGPDHMDPEQAAQSVALLRPGLVVPIHWGTFLPVGSAGRHRQVLRDPARAFAARVAEVAPSVAVRVLAPGESLALGDA